MSEKKLEIDQLEERIAPSSLNLGSLADGLLSGANASNALSGDSVGSNNDPSITGNTIGLLTGNSANTGPVNVGVQG